MADKDLTVHLKADDNITPVAKKAAAELKKLEKPIEIDVDVDQALRSFDDLLAEVKQIDAAADALGSALGPELAAKADTRSLVVDLRQMGVTLDQIKGNADQFGAKLKELADADVGGKMGASLGTTRGKMDELRSSTDQTRSVMANFAGNAAQDLGALGGAAGSAGVAIGQFAEYAAEGNIALSGLLKAIGPMAAITAGIALLKYEMGQVAETKAFNKDRVEAFADALADAAVSAEELQEVLSAKGDPRSLLARIGTETKDVEESVRSTMGTFEDFNDIVQGGAGTFNEWASSQLAAAAAAGASESEIANLDAAMQRGLETTQANAAVAFALGDGYDAQVEAAFAAGAAIRQKGDAEREAGEDTKFYGEATKEAAEASEDANKKTASYARTLRETAEAARALMVTEQEAADMRRGLADSEFAYRDAQRDLVTAITETTAALAENGPATLEGAAALDEFAQQAGTAADAAVRLQADQMTAAGATQSATQAQKTWNSAMVTSARQAEGPLRDAIVDYIATVNGIPAEKVSEILANPDYATIDAAEAAITQAAADQTATIKAEAETAAANAELDAIAARKRTAVIQARVAYNENVGLGGSNAAVPRSVAPATAGVSTYAAAAAPAPTGLPPIVVNVPVPVAVTPSITFNVGVMGNRFDSQRAVTRALRGHQRFNGERP